MRKEHNKEIQCNYCEGCGYNYAGDGEVWDCEGCNGTGKRTEMQVYDTIALLAPMQRPVDFAQGKPNMQGTITNIACGEVDLIVAILDSGYGVILQPQDYVLIGGAVCKDCSGSGFKDNEGEFFAVEFCTCEAGQRMKEEPDKNTERGYYYGNV